MKVETKRYREPGTDDTRLCLTGKGRTIEMPEATEASDLIGRLEAETGQRIDSNNGDNNAMAGLFGAISRIMGQSPPSYRECDDVVAGLRIRHQMSPEGRREKANNKMIADMLTSGMSPDDIKALLG